VAHDINEELTVIMSSLDLAIGATHGETRCLLMDAMGAARRCTWKTAGLLSFNARRGIQPTAATAETVIGLLEKRQQ
jgi:hypothetical protein